MAEPTKKRTLRAEIGLNPIPMVKRATGRMVPDLTGREHVCEWQRLVREDALGKGHYPIEDKASAGAKNDVASRTRAFKGKLVDYISRDAVTNHDADKLELAKELARYALLSFSLQVSEHPDACLLRNVCYCILNTDGHTDDVRPLLATLRERNSTK